MARALRRDINLPPPTWFTLKRLAAFASIDEAWAWASVTPIVRIQPGFVRDGDTATITLPGDPSEETRFELVDGAWRPVRP